MSRSIHVTKKNFKGLTKKEINEQANDPHSDFTQWNKKSIIKKMKKKRNSSSSNKK